MNKQSELKTLKNLRARDIKKRYIDGRLSHMISEDILRKEAIEWVKEDISQMVITPNITWLLNRWKKRLNIAEEDLK